MQEVYKAIGRVAGQNINVLICGESGTGKELVARAIHQHSDRADKKFLAVNCAAIPESILESELFGHEKGSFTGATGQRIGKFEECDGGTLFLDEVGDMPLLMQSKVLRAIQEKEFQRVGGNHTVTSDVRIVAATNRDLESMVLDEEFRADLSFRLNGYSILLPPLRGRREDIPLLVEHYLRLFNIEIGKSITSVAPEAMDLLERFSWPGNIRELQTVLKHAMLHAIGPTLLADFLPAELRQGAMESPAAARRDAAAAARNDAAASARHEAAAPAPRHETVPAAPATDAIASHGHEDAPFQHYLQEQIQSGTHSLYADSVKYLESDPVDPGFCHTDGNQSRRGPVGHYARVPPQQAAAAWHYDSLLGRHRRARRRRRREGQSAASSLPRSDAAYELSAREARLKKEKNQLPRRAASHRNGLLAITRSRGSRLSCDESANRLLRGVQRPHVFLEAGSTRREPAAVPHGGRFVPLSA